MLASLNLTVFLFWFGGIFYIFLSFYIFLFSQFSIRILFSSWAFHKYLVVDSKLMFWIGRAENNSKNIGSEAIQSWVQTCLWGSSIQKHLTSGSSQNCCVYIRPFFFLSPWKAVVKPIVFWLLFWSFDIWGFLGLALSYSL